MVVSRYNYYVCEMSADSSLTGKQVESHSAVNIACCVTACDVKALKVALWNTRPSLTVRGIMCIAYICIRSMEVTMGGRAYAIWL